MQQLRHFGQCFKRKFTTNVIWSNLCRRCRNPFIYEPLNDIVKIRKLSLLVDSFPNTLEKLTISNFTQIRSVSMSCLKRSFCTNEAAVNDNARLEENGDDLIDIARQIVEIAAKVDVTYLGMQAVAVSCMQCLTSLGIELNDARELLINSPYLIKVPIKKLSRFCESLLLNGFNTTQLLTLIPASLCDGVSENVILKQLDILRNLGFHDWRLFDLLSTNPEVVRVSEKELKTRIDNLKALFKTDDVINLAMKSNVLLDDWSVIMKTFNYAYHAMGIRQRQMVSTNLFIYSLRHIQNRHKFLERAGFYVLLKSKDIHKSTNPRLKIILSLADKQFAKQFGDMSQRDYETFCKMMDEERKLQEGNNYSDDEIDDDSDDDDNKTQ